VPETEYILGNGATTLVASTTPENIPVGICVVQGGETARIFKEDVLESYNIMGMIIKKWGLKE